ncbi:glycosyltransferase family 4 protein [Arthrospiribacter ruber]|uniref:Glycosyltransferase n=1 Tax=Arthrospiribacter ruber TaxID=2487934 RepID=A0A951IWU1_9BACT|nr:glycosyltransferase family 4 protein [Arthrospiribacter ruber]MBW3468313.1 glycosyltransferase [Arthrospiribacter ruber]
MNNRILITVPNLYLPGGVAVLYSSLDFQNQGLAQYFPIYFDEANFTRLGKVKRLIFKYTKFFKVIDMADTILINPSLTFNSFLRDSIFAIIAKLRKKKLIVFWHGWEEETEYVIKNSTFMRFLFKISFGRADGTIILGTVFKNKIRDLGLKMNSEFLLFQNVANSGFIDYEKSFSPKKIQNEVRILFMSRIEENKGALEVVKIFQGLKEKNNGINVQLTVAGDGEILSEIKEYIKENKIQNVIFPGHVEGLDKHILFERSHLFVFPSSYGEGMPLVIIEGMAYGLPIISSPKGGIPDIIQEGVNGFLVDSDDIDGYIDNIINIINNSELYEAISTNNFAYAFNNLTPDVGRKKLIDFCNKVYEK